MYPTSSIVINTLNQCAYPAKKLGTILRHFIQQAFCKESLKSIGIKVLGYRYFEFGIAGAYPSS